MELRAHSQAASTASARSSARIDRRLLLLLAPAKKEKDRRIMVATWLWARPSRRPFVASLITIYRRRTTQPSTRPRQTRHPTRQAKGKTDARWTCRPPSHAVPATLQPGGVPPRQCLMSVHLGRRADNSSDRLQFQRESEMGT